MKRYGNIWDKITNIENIKTAHKMASKDKSYYREVRMVNSDPDKYLAEVKRLLETGKYKVSEYRVQVIDDKGKERRLMKLKYYPDRIIQWAIMLQLEKIFLNTFCYHTCASIPGRGIKHAYKLVTQYLKDAHGTKYCLKMDVRKFYDNIDHEILKRLLRKKLKDARVLALLDQIIDSYPGEKGVPIGSYLSQYFANFYLAFLDHHIKETLGMKYVVRYMDDIIIFSDSKERLHRALESVKDYLKGLKLELKGNYQIFPTNVRGVDFVGYRFFRHFILLRKKSLTRVKKLSVRLQRRMERHERISYKEWCGAMAYVGWIIWCDSWRLYQRFIAPIIPALCEFYWYVINEAHRVKRTRVKSFNRYKRKLLLKQGRCVA